MIDREYMRLRDQPPFSLLKGDEVTQADRYELIEELMAQALLNVVIARKRQADLQKKT